MEQLLLKYNLMKVLLDKINEASGVSENADGISFKSGKVHFYRKNKDGILFKQCGKCEQYLPIEKFANNNLKTNECIYKKNYICRGCNAQKRVGKERGYYEAKMKKKNPNYVPLKDRPKKEKVKKSKKVKEETNITRPCIDKVIEEPKIEESTNLAHTNIPIEPVKIIEINKIEKLPVKEVIPEVKIEKKKRTRKNPYIEKLRFEESLKAPEIAQNLEKIVLEEKKRRYSKKSKPLEASTNPSQTVIHETQSQTHNKMNASHVSELSQPSVQCSSRRRKVKV